MKRLMLTLFTAPVLAIAMTPSADARCEHNSFASKARAADLIMTGTVQSQEFIGFRRAGLRKGETDAYAESRNETPLWKWRLYKFIPDRVFKGKKESFELIVSPRKFSSGGRYIIFARKNVGLQRYKDTMASYVNEQCDPADYLYPSMGSDLLDDTKDYFSTIQFK